SEANAAASKLKSAGTPDVSEGKQISSSLVNAFNQLGSSLKQAGASASSLSTSSAAAFKSGFLTIQNNIRSSLTSLLSGLGSLHSSQLSQAAKKEPACTSLAG